MRFTTASRCLFVFLVVAFSASVSFAQFSGGVTGVVQDATGASVPKANVVLVQVGTQVTRTVVTDANGGFNFVSLAPANYELSADAAGFAKTVASDGAVPLVQMDPERVSVADVASGRYDGYLSAYAEAVRAYHYPVIVSFGHEMNGDWYPWGYKKTSPAVFVAAWRHIVGLFRALGAQNVTWLWTVNVIDDTRGGSIVNPAKWWPGSSYVTWVGIDGYYLKPSWQFAPLFGPTIGAVRALTADPILISETGAVPTSGQPAKINDLFAGVRSYGLLGFVWFNSTNSIGQSFGISSPAAIAAFRKGATAFGKPG